MPLDGADAIIRTTVETFFNKHVEANPHNKFTYLKFEIVTDLNLISI